MKFIIACLSCLAVCGSLAAASHEPVDDTRSYFEVLRSDVNKDKVTVYNKVLKLTPAEAEKFWPIYRDYEHELGKLAEQKLQLMRRFLERDEAGKLTNEEATALADQWLKNAQIRLDLWKKYHQKISEAVSPTRAAQFLQLEHQLALFIDIAIATEMPAITPATK